MLLLISIGILIGAVLGLTGAGGSVIAVPILLLALNISPTEAMGLSLGVVAASSLYGSWRRIIYPKNRKEVLWIAAIIFAISGMALAPLGRIAATHLNDSLLLIGFSILALSISIKMIWQSIKHPEQTSIVRGQEDVEQAEGLLCRFSKSNKFDLRFRCMAGLTIGGIITGFLSGLFGVGGGFLIVPFLNQLNNMPMRHAVATSLVIIAGISTSGFISHVAMQGGNMQEVNWQQLATLGVGGIIGMFVGSKLAHKIAGVHLQRIFALTIVCMTCLLIFTRLS